MGSVYADITIANSVDEVLASQGDLPTDKVRRAEVRALVDSGAYMLCINQNLRLQLGLRKMTEMVAELANGSMETVDVVGPVEVRFENRSTSCRAAVLPGDVEVLLGSIPMEDLDVIILPKEQRLVVNPESPYLAKKKIK
ncbi:MAG: retroviral-like aspartic protease [bacterium]|nr:retroviral-like aspartic protease [bacterium]